MNRVLYKIMFRIHKTIFKIKRFFKPKSTEPTQFELDAMECRKILTLQEAFELPQYKHKCGDVIEEENKLVYGCPFCEEHTLWVNPKIQYYLCKNCETHGDIMVFVAKRQGLSPKDAIEFIHKLKDPTKREELLSSLT